MNGSGYVRQAAVRALGHHRHAEAVAFTLWALRDWVPQVRDEAKQSLSRLMTPELAAAFVMQHRLLARLARAQRADLRGTLDRIDQYLRGPQCAPAVEGVLISEDPMVRLYAYRLSADRLRDDVALQARAAADPSPKIRRWFVDRVAEFDAQTGRLWLEKLIHDESFIVGRNVIWNLTPELKQAMWATLLDAACSDQRQIRASVRYSLSDMHSQDFAEVYRKRIAAVEPERVRPGWIEGLGETGTGEDVTDIEQFASSGNSRMRRAALRAIASLSSVTSAG